ncbi:MAG: hypothetical protein AAFR17_03700, partial [Pseudomonadota bacterium]
MLEPNIVTIVAKIRCDEQPALERLLEDEIDPSTGKALAFHRLPHLHFASFCILDAVEDLPAYLVMEATFDGAPDDFLADLVEIADAQLIRIFTHCAGFPAQPNKDLLSDY